MKKTKTFLVQFTVPAKRVDEYREIIGQAFGLCLGRSKHWSDVDILCRPEQFADFLIRRSDAGLCNVYAELRARKVPTYENAHFFDVSKS